MEQEKNPKDSTIETSKNQQGQQDQKPKRERKTIEQELAELEAKKQKILNKKRKEENHEKIVFGAIVISILKKLRATKDENNLKEFCKIIAEHSKEFKEKDQEIVKNVIARIYNLSAEQVKEVEEKLKS